MTLVNTCSGGLLECDFLAQMGISEAVTVRVDGVIVVPMRAEGVAYAHAADGRCVTLTGPREQMVELCSRVKAAALEGTPAIHVNASDFSGIEYLPAGECPVHDATAA